MYSLIKNGHVIAHIQPNQLDAKLVSELYRLGYQLRGTYYGR